MKITIKNLKHASYLSQETHAYTATIYVDGIRAFNASNQGHGGSDMYDQIGPYTEREVSAWLDANLPRNPEFPDFETCLEFVVGDLINAELARRALNKLLRSKVLVLEHGNLYSYNVKPTEAALEAYRGRVLSGSINGQVVNGNPELEAIALTKV